MHRSLALALCLGVAIAILPHPALAQSCVSGTVTAEFNADPAYPGLWKYCVEVEWFFDRYDLSHVSVFLQVPACPCICDPRFIKFTSPAGHATNTAIEPPCGLDYAGSYVCLGDPSLPDLYNGPAIKFEPVDESCPPGVMGYGTFCFYSPMPPQDPATHANAVAIKHGRGVCYGELQGAMPSCDCSVPTHSSTWGELKSTYR